MAALRFFEQEFISHIDEKLCSAGQCKPLVRAKCINTCPAGVDTPAYLALVAEGRYEEGLAIHRERNPFPLICGRACPAFCEKKCRRGELDDPVAIRLIKRYMADQELHKPWTPQPTAGPEEFQANSATRIAVVGAGPGGLTAALRLAQRGYKVTVFEKLPVPGGMLSAAIPEYRLPRQLLFGEIENIKRAGVEIHCNTALGRDFSVEDLLHRDGFKAVILAIGAFKSRRLGIPGEEKEGVMHGLDFLRRVALASSMRALGQEPLEPVPDVRGKRVGVIGGGDVAIDVARSALRMGAREVHVIYRRAGEHMPAAHLPEEIEAARNEGVRIHTLVTPTEVLGNGHVSGVRLQQQRLADFDKDGRRRPVPLGSEAYTLNLDMLIPAVGQAPDQSWMKNGDIQLSGSDTFVVNDAFGTTHEGIFAIGDAVNGPSTIVQAVAQGNLVAVAVEHWVKTGQLDKPRYLTERRDLPEVAKLEEYVNARRPETPRLSVADRDGNFHEVEVGFDGQTAQEEAKRCLRCDLEWLDVMKLPRPQSVPVK